MDRTNSSTDLILLVYGERQQVFTPTDPVTAVMDEKTEELRDVFLDVTGEETVTERQTEGRGSLAADPETEKRLREAVAAMREALGFGTELDDEELVTVVEGFYDGASDAEIARRLGGDSLSKTVARARVELHLLRDADTDAPFELNALREGLDAGRSVADLADEFGVAPSTVRRYRRVLEAKSERRRTNDRFRAAFEDALGDALSERMTSELKEKGLEGATEGQETNVSF
jgi:transposase-like protein